MRTRLHNRLPRWHRWTVYGLTAVLVVSGLAWLGVAYVFAPAGEPRPAPHDWAGPMLTAHGIAAYAALIFYALVGQAHLRTGWRVTSLRNAGLWLCAMVAVLALTGVGLYYVSAEGAIPLLRWAHVAAGLALPGWLVLHILRGRRISGRH
jgi:hypothetical protein